MKKRTLMLCVFVFLATVQMRGGKQGQGPMVPPPPSLPQKGDQQPSPYIPFQNPNPPLVAPGPQQPKKQY